MKPCEICGNPSVDQLCGNYFCLKHYKEALKHADYLLQKMGVRGSNCEAADRPCD